MAAGLTVVTPIKNGASNVKHLWPVLRREFGGDEAAAWIAVDDGSVDGTFDLLASLAARDARVTVCQAGGVGAGPARNLGLDHVRTRWVTFVDVDDDLEPGALGAWTAVAERLRSDVFVSASPTGLTRRRQRRWEGSARALEPHERWTSELFRDWIPGGKVYSVALVRRHRLRYSAAKEGQDLGFFVAAAVAADRLGFDPVSPRYRYGAASNTSPRKPPRAPAETFAEFGRALSMIEASQVNPQIGLRVASPVHAGACHALLRALAFAPGEAERRALIADFLEAGCRSSVDPRVLSSLDRRDIALCLAAWATVRGGDGTAALLSSLHMWRHRRRQRSAVKP